MHNDCTIPSHLFLHSILPHEIHCWGGCLFFTVFQIALLERLSYIATATTNGMQHGLGKNPNQCSSSGIVVPVGHVLNLQLGWGELSQRPP